MTNQNEQQINISPTGERLEIWHGQLPSVFVFANQKFAVESTASFIELIKWKGSKENTIISYDKDCLDVILDCTVTDRPQDRGRFTFQLSQDMKEWSGIFGKQIPQKFFVDFLRRLPVGQLINADAIMGAVQTLKIATSFMGDYTFNDNNNYVVMFKVQDAEGSTEIPSLLNIAVPILNESDLVSDIEIELELQKPTSDGQRPLFTLRCPKWERYYREAVAHEVEVLKKALPGYLILAGQI